MNNNKKLKIFFSGIAGSGMSAIAGFAADKGHIVVGSDRALDINPFHQLKKTLQSKGITILPQDGNGIDVSFDFVVFSTAVEPDQPEFVKAGALGILVKTRPEYLSEITASFKTIAVSGTSGKSTTSGMLAFLMNRLGLKPNFIGGGRVKQFKSPLNPGNYLADSSDCLIIEACESDGTIVNYRPQHLIILNLSLDHHTVDKTAEMFKALVENTSGKIILNADDKSLIGKITGKNAITFSLHNPSHYKADDIIYKQFSADFSLRGTKFSLSLPGEYNLYNAVSCIAMLSEIGISPAVVADVLHEFKGIDRRFDIYLNDSRGLVIDDYAHNPHKISSLMKTVIKIREHICYIFQPHGFGPTRLMKKEYIEAFTENLRNTDHLVLLPIFYAGGTAARDISSHDLADAIKTAGKSVEVIEKREDILKRLIHEYDSFVIFGARDETLAELAKEIARVL
jgi:UDP-N-acetylmuramate--alanine ligase